MKLPSINVKLCKHIPLAESMHTVSIRLMVILGSKLSGYPSQNQVM